MTMVLVSLFLLASCDNCEEIPEAVVSKSIAFSMSDLEYPTINDFYAGINIATFISAPVQEFQILTYKVYYESISTGGEWLVLNLSTSDFTITDQNLRNQPEYGAFWKTDFRSNKKLSEYRPEMISVRQITLQIRYKVNGIWYKTSLDNFIPGYTTDTFWV